MYEGSRDMHDHHHLSMDTLQRHIRESITLQGFAIRHVTSFGRHPEFSYTVGLYTPGSTKPELFISGLSRTTRVYWLLHLGFLIQGPPSLAAQQRLAKAQGVPRESLVFPQGGYVFQPGVCYTNLAENGLPTCFGEVEPCYYHDYFGQAIVFHGTQTFPVLQMVWSDTQGCFPFEQHFERRFQGKQRLLFDPQRYLPLREMESEEG